MNFQELHAVEDYKFYLDLAFRRARERGDKLRDKKLKGGRLEKSNHIVLMKMNVIADTIASRMVAIVKNYPSFDDLPEFYKELVKLNVDYRQLKKSLGAIDWLGKNVMKMFREYKTKLLRNKQFDRINFLQKEYLGRISSLMKQVKSDFLFLENSRKTLRNLPVVKTGLKTVAIAGFPNVGKTTLMHNLTGSKAEINTYPFTTKGLNVAYIGDGKDRIQLIDTPGTLDRFEKMNNIERMAYLAIKLCAEKIVYIFDLTEEYPLEKQEKLFRRLKQDFDKEIIVYLSKEDIVEKQDIDVFLKKYKDGITDPEKLRRMIETV